MRNTIKRLNQKLLSTLFLSMAATTNIIAQDGGSALKGIVSDQYNNPVPGVVVKLKGTDQTTVTDANGEYSLKCSKGDVLTFTHVNFLYKEVKVGKIEKNKASKSFNVHLADQFVETGLPVDAAYGEKKEKENFLGAASTVYTKDLDKYLAPNILTAVQGRIPGFNISQYRGFALKNTSSNTQLNNFMGTFASRNGAGIYGDNSQFNYALRGQSPVVIVDGVEREMLDIDPEAIESITVEKDALSSIFLGMRSSRGALIITTKQPSQGKLNLSFTAKVGTHSSIKDLHPLDAATYSYLLNEALTNDGKNPLYSYEDYQLYKSGTDPYFHPNVNWADELLRNSAISQSYNLNVSGGGKVAQYFVSLGYLNEDGLFKEDSANEYNTNLTTNRYMISSKVHINITKNFEATMTALGRIEDGNQPGGSGSGYSDLLLNIYNMPNNAYPIKNPNGTWGGTMSYQNNLYSQTMNSGYIADHSRDIQASLKLRYDFDDLVKGLSLNAVGSVASMSRTAIDRTKASVVYDIKKDSQGLPVYTMYGSNKPQQNNFTDVASYTYMWGQLSVDYARSFGQHNLKAQLAGNTRHQISDFDLPMIPSNVMESLSYDYGKKYFAQVALTESYYNRYAPGNRWGTFWAAGLGWDISKEHFMEDLSWVDKLKLRATFGRTGSGMDNSGYYIFRQTYSQQGSSYYPQGESNGSNIRFTTEDALANPYITWEKANKFNIGLDAELFHKQFILTADYYNDKYFDLLQYRGKSIELLGAGYPLENIGKVRRSGLELSATWQSRISDFNYYLTGS